MGKWKGRMKKRKKEKNMTFRILYPGSKRAEKLLEIKDASIDK